MQQCQVMSDLTAEQNDLLTQLKSTRKDGEFLRSYLLIGAQHLLNVALTRALAKLFLCTNDHCNSCKNCHLLAADSHPDMQYIASHGGNSIKIESIRELQTNISKSLSVAKYKLVIINTADKLNIQAASALLKILEEPPEHTIFVLLAGQMSSIPITVVSRCHKYFMRDYSLQNFDASYFDIASYYADNDERALLVQRKAEFLTNLLDLLDERTTVCDIASKLQGYKLENILWFLYLLTAELVNIVALRKYRVTDQQLQKLASSQSLSALYKQVDKLQQAIKMQLANVTLNNLLVIENILLEYETC